MLSIARDIKPSGRHELEITAIHQAYLDRDALCVERMDRGFTWLDAGTPDPLVAPRMRLNPANPLTVPPRDR